MCKHHEIIENGHRVCTSCAAVLGVHLTPTITSFNHPSGPARAVYSRTTRFRKLILKIQGRTAHEIEPELIEHMMQKRPKSVDELLLVIKRWPDNTKPKPYESASTLWYYCSGDKPVVLEFWEEKLLICMFNQYDCRTRDDGYTKTPPYPFLIRCFLEEKILMFDKERFARIVRFIPLMKCKWRLRYYSAQYAHVRRVFDDEIKNPRCINDVLARNKSYRILCKTRRNSCPTNAIKVSHKRVQKTETLLWKKGRRRDSNSIRRERKATLQKSVSVDSRNIWETEAIKQLLGHARKWQCQGRSPGKSNLA